jgi:hypothetical protein
MPPHPLAEVFGFPTDNSTEEARRHRQDRLCPFNNRSPNCTKSSVEHPIGVCSVYHDDKPVITCPIRFRERWIIASDAAAFFFGPDARWTSLTEVRLQDRHGKSAGNIDVVLVAYDQVGRVVDYGALEVQAVYISGNISTPFLHYMEAPDARAAMDWRGQPNYPRPDYLSSSRKRLAPQLIYKGGILNAWKRKMAVALNTGFFNTLPAMEPVDAAEADIAWLVYDLAPDPVQQRLMLKWQRTVYTKFEASLLRITRSEAGEEFQFLHHLQTSVNRKLHPGRAFDLEGTLRDDE